MPLLIATKLIAAHPSGSPAWRQRLLRLQRHSLGHLSLPGELEAPRMASGLPMAPADIRDGYLIAS